MSNQDILAILQQNEIHTVGDLDHYASIRQLSRWHALAQLVGEVAADYILAKLRERTTTKPPMPQGSVLMEGTR